MEFFSIDKIYTSWTIKRILRHVLYWGFWVVFYGTINSAHSEAIDMKIRWYVLEVLMLVVKVPLAYFFAYSLFPKFLPQKKYIPLFVFVVLSTFVGLFTVVQINHVFVMPMQPMELLSGKAFFRFADLIYITMPVVVIKLVQQQVVQNKIHLETLSEKTNAELQILKNQLQPHFLFNTLNNIYGMILEQEKEAGDAVLKLSEIISYMLYDGNHKTVALEKEIRMLENYIVLEKMRYGNQLDISFETRITTKGKLIAPLLLLPFVENAFKHGVSNNPSSSWIRIQLHLEDDTLFFSMENSLDSNSGKKYQKSGIGLANVRKRLALIYPDKHTLQIVEEEYFLVKLNLVL